MNENSGKYKRVSHDDVRYFFCYIHRRLLNKIKGGVHTVYWKDNISGKPGGLDLHGKRGTR